MKLPISILAYNRPHYLWRVLQTLVPQVEDREVWVYIDQPRTHHDSPYVSDSLRFVKEILPQAKIHMPDKNAGIATMTRWIRQDLFSKFDLFHFFEDDLELGREYILNNEQLASLFVNNDNVGMVNSFGEPHRTLVLPNWVEKPNPVTSHDCPYRDVHYRWIQGLNYANLIQMQHNWGYVIFKRAYEKAKPLMDEYYKIVGSDYSNRSHSAIYEFHSKNDIKNAVSSQDSTFAAIMAKVGLARISSFASCGKMIGAWGVHMNLREYESQKWGKLETYNDCIGPFSIIQSKEMADWILKSQQDFYLTKGAL